MHLVLAFVLPLISVVAADSRHDSRINLREVSKILTEVPTDLSEVNSSDSSSHEDSFDTEEPGYSVKAASGHRNCLNSGGSLTQVYGKCDPSKSKGIKSAHNCKNIGGKYYYCKVAKNEGQCIVSIWL